ncbi:Protein CL16A [Mortierella antarctica]|nr:Protein CL16A [Mortierella antarctica]
MFENVRSRESLYFLLSNNYVNQVICLRYDFSNDEILAYYIYLLRTLSFKLSKDTIYFFFNEHLDDFPLYSEAIKFFNHEESMIRIAVRVITLNVYSVNDHQMQDFILDRTTTTYFSNLVWFIGNYGTTVNDMLLHPGEGEFSRMNYYLAEHMDCFYYVNDIIELEVSKINKILISHLLNRLLRPMYLDSLLPSGVLVSTGGRASTTSKLSPLVALSLMLHAFHVLKHAPLVSALASTLFSNQHYSSPAQQQNHHHHHHHNLLRPSPLVLGSQSVSPESSRPASPVTSKFHSFGLLGTSPAAFESSMPSLSASSPTARQSPQTLTPLQIQSSNTESLTGSQQLNPYRAAIYEYLSAVDTDRLVLPALALVYLAGRNSGVMSDVLLSTDIYPQRLLKSRRLMGNLMSLAPQPKQCTTAMTRERSADSILSSNSGNSHWHTAAPVPGPLPTIAGSLFGAAGVSAASRMRTRTESPLFETDEDNAESRETQELLDADHHEPAPHPDTSTSHILANSLPSPAMAMNRAIGGEGQRKSKPPSGPRRGSKASSLLGPILPPLTIETPEALDKEDGLGQELKPVFTSKKDRDLVHTYAFVDEDDDTLHEQEQEQEQEQETGHEQNADTPPPLPPRPVFDEQGEASSIQESIGTQSGPVIQNREDLMDRLVDIICGQPESGAHRFRILTIQVATELLIEFVYTKGGPGKDNSQGAAAVQHSATVESQLGETRLHRLALAEVQFRERVRKGILALEQVKRNAEIGQPGPGTTPQPLGIPTGRVERALTESKLGIDKQIVNLISESSIVYGPDPDPDNEPDLDPDPELVALFGLDSEYTSMAYEKPTASEDVEPPKDQSDSPPASNSSNGSAMSSQIGRRRRFRDTLKTKMHGMHGTPPPSATAKDIQQMPRRSQVPSSNRRLEAMVIRYIKWLHILMQSKQLLCWKAALMTDEGSVEPFGLTTATTESPSIAITRTSTSIPTPMQRRPSDLMLGTSAPSGAVTSAHKGLQKALATTGTTTTAKLTLDPSSTSPGMGLLPASSPASSPSATSDSAISTAPSASSSTSSLSSMTTNSPAISATLSQPAMGTASGRIIGSRTLLTATAALEAAAANAATLAGSSTHPQGTGVTVGISPFMNEMLTTHLDPLSASVSEAIRKSSARIRKSVVDPLSANGLFKSSLSAPSSAISSSLTVGQDTVSSEGYGSTGQGSSKGGFYRPSDVSSAGSSATSLVKPIGQETRQRAMSDTSSWTFQSTSNADRIVLSAEGRSVAQNDPATSCNVDAEDTNTEGRFMSILDPGHPAHQNDGQVAQILGTLGLMNPSATSSASFVEK